jgi:hypothetical protein
LPSLATASLVAVAAPAAALEKCVGPDGSVVYSDRPCAAGAKRSSIGVDTSLADAQIEYYDVSSPGGHKGHAYWHLSYTYRTRAAPGGGCTVESLSTKLDLKVRMPRWTPQAGAAADLTRRWERYLDALRVHEAGHLQNGRDFEAGFRTAALGMAPADCGALGAMLQARFDQMLEQARTRDRDYDAETRNGATQGAYFQ